MRGLLDNSFPGRIHPNARAVVFGNEWPSFRIGRGTSACRRRDRRYQARRTPVAVAWPLPRGRRLPVCPRGLNGGSSKRGEGAAAPRTGRPTPPPPRGRGEGLSETGSAALDRNPLRQRPCQRRLRAAALEGGGGRRRRLPLRPHLTAAAKGGGRGGGGVAKSAQGGDALLARASPRGVTAGPHPGSKRAPRSPRRMNDCIKVESGQGLLCIRAILYHGGTIRGDAMAPPKRGGAWCPTCSFLPTSLHAPPPLQRGLCCSSRPPQMSSRLDRTGVI